MTVLFCTPAISKTFSTNRVDSKEDWSVFMENNPSFHGKAPSDEELVIALEELS